MNIVKILKKNGYKVDPESEPIATLLDFNDVKIIDFEKSPIENELRNYELMTIAGFKGGEIFVTLKLIQNSNHKRS
jgi:hypothetical protein